MIALLTACLFFCNPCARTELHQQKGTRKLCSATLKREQKEAVSRLLEGKDVLVVLPTGFGKSLIYQSFVLAKEMAESSVGCSYFRLKFYY